MFVYWGYGLHREKRGGLPGAMIYMDMDAFYASVEQRDHPHLRGRPTFVTHKTDDPYASDRGAVIATSYEARSLGLRGPSSVLEVRRRLGPDAAFVRSDFEKYLAICRQLYDICESYGPTEAVSVDEFYLEVAGPRSRFGFELFAAAELQRRVRDELDLPVSVGVGYSKRSAKAVAESVKPRGLAEVRSPGHFVEQFGDSPVTVVQGIAKPLARHLAGLGIYTISDLAAADPLRLVKRFGVNGWSLSRAGRGYGGGRLEPGFKRRRVRSVGHSLTMRGIRDMVQIERALLGLAEGVAKRLRRQHRSGRAVTTWINFDRLFSRVGRASAPQPVVLTGPIYRLALRTLRRFESLTDSYPVTGLGISVSGLSPGIQLSFSGDRELRLAFACDEIERRFGKGAVKRSALAGWRRDYQAAPGTEVG